VELVRAELEMGLEATVVPQVEQLEAVRLLTEVQQHQDKEITVETPTVLLREEREAEERLTRVPQVEQALTNFKQVMRDRVVTVQHTLQTLQ
jgi:hypothetical protein